MRAHIYVLGNRKGFQKKASGNIWTRKEGRKEINPIGFRVFKSNYNYPLHFVVVAVDVVVQKLVVLVWMWKLQQLLVLMENRMWIELVVPAVVVVEQLEPVEMFAESMVLQVVVVAQVKQMNLVLSVILSFVVVNVDVHCQLMHSLIVVVVQQQLHLHKMNHLMNRIVLLVVVVRNRMVLPVVVHNLQLVRVIVLRVLLHFVDRLELHLLHI